MGLELFNIIKECRSGNRKAQQQLFERFAGQLMTVSRQYTPNNLDPMDNLQDSFIKIFDHIDSFDPAKGRFEDWARRIVINTALKKINKNSIKEVALTYEEIPETFENHIMDTEDIEQLMYTIEQLPDGYKQVFCLYEIEGYSHKEIAELLKIKEATSRSQLNKSKNLLKVWLSSKDQKIVLNLQPESYARK